MKYSVDHILFTFLKILFEALHLQQERAEDLKKTIINKGIAVRTMFTATQSKDELGNEGVGNIKVCLLPGSPVFICGVCYLNDVSEADLRENLWIDNQLIICPKKKVIKILA